MDTARDLSSQRPAWIGGRRGSNRTAANQGEAAPARAASDLQLAWRRASVPATGAREEANAEPPEKIEFIRYMTQMQSL